MNNKLIDFFASHLAKLICSISSVLYNNHRKKIFMFFPLASVGGAEIVHGDIMAALKDYKPSVFIRYKGNVWVSHAYARTQKAKKKGSTMLPFYKKYAKVVFLSDWFESKRFARFTSAFYKSYLIQKINNTKNPVLIFWHRESIDFLWESLKPNVKRIDIIHNLCAGNNEDKHYVNFDKIKQLDKRVTITKQLERKMIEWYNQEGIGKEYTEKLKTINHMVYIPEKLPEKEKGNMKILFVGRNVPEKRIHLIFQIAEKTKSCATYTLIGPASNEFKNIPANVNVLGEIINKEEIQMYYSLTHCFILTSVSEGFPKTIAEAMAFGCVPISVAVGGITDVVCHNKNGILIQTKNENEIVNDSVKEINYLYNNFTLFNQLSYNAYISAKEEFAEKNFFSKWQQVIQEI